MNLAALRTLRAVLVHGNFTAAGAAVGCTPSAVSLQVKQLEQYFGKPLFDRSTRIVKPTPFAVEVAAVAASIADKIETLRTTPSLAVEGRLRLGVISSVQSELLPLVYRWLTSKHPALEVQIPALNGHDSGEILAELKSGRIDAAVLVRPDNGGTTRIDWHDLLQQPYVMLAPTGANEHEPKKLLNAYGWISYEPGTSVGRAAARAARAFVPNLAPKLELRSIDAIVSMVSAGVGVAICPRPRARLLAGYDVQTIGLGRAAPFRRISLAWRKSDADNRRIEAVRDAFAAVTPSVARPMPVRRPAAVP